MFLLITCLYTLEQFTSQNHAAISHSSTPHTEPGFATSTSWTRLAHAHLMPSRMPIITTSVSTRSQFMIATLRHLIDSNSLGSAYDYRLATASAAPFLGFPIFIHCCHIILRLRSDHPLHSIDHSLCNSRISTQDVAYLRFLKRSSIVDTRLRLPSPCTIAGMLHLNQSLASCIKTYHPQRDTSYRPDPTHATDSPCRDPFSTW